MSASTVRAAVAAFITPPNVVNLNTVYRAEPKLIPGDAFFGQSSTGAGAVAVVHIGRQSEKLRAIGGGTRERSVSYQIDLILRYRDVSGDAEVAQDGFDDLVESLKARLRSDPTFGTSGAANPIMFAGLGSGVPSASAGDDLIIQQDLPRQEKQGGGVLIWAVLQIVNVVEVVVS